MPELKAARLLSEGFQVHGCKCSPEGNKQGLDHVHLLVRVGSFICLFGIVVHFSLSQLLLTSG